MNTGEPAGCNAALIIGAVIVPAYTIADAAADAINVAANCEASNAAPPNAIPDDSDNTIAVAAAFHPPFHAESAEALTNASTITSG